MKKQRVFPIRFSTRVIGTLIIVVLLTALTVGLPAIWILESQLDHQARAQVEQGQRVAAALYSAKVQEIQNLALLTAQRPTLKELITEDRSDVLAYLRTLEESTGLSCIVVCDSSDGIFVSTDESLPGDICDEWQGKNYPYNLDMPIAYIAGNHPIQDASGFLGEVFVCKQLDHTFVSEISQETGVEHTILAGSTILATSYESKQERETIEGSSELEQNGTSSLFDYQLQGEKYYATLIPLDNADLNVEIAINISDIVSVQQNIAIWMVAAILGIVVVVSLLGIAFSRQISRPLEKLAGSAETFKKGDLHQQVNTDISVLEVAQVAQALEAARTDLLNTLTFLQSERDWGEHLLSSIVEGIVTLDSKGKITYFSHGAERITGWSRDEVMGKTSEEVFQPALGDDSFIHLIPAPGKRAKVDVLLSAGKQASLAITRAELAPTDAALAEIALVFRDISEEEAVHRLLGHFLANVAHEFRTPLAALAASIELLLDQSPELSHDEINELLISLHLGILGLQTLVDNLLESASIEAGHFRIFPRATDLGKIVADSIETMRPLLNKYGQRLVLDLPADIPVVRADPRRSIQVLVNLINNASKYGPADDEIELKVTRINDMARIQVIDRGAGIGKNARQNLFRRFVYPADDDHLSPSGAGLGLSVVKAIVEAHGGDVGVEDNPHGGSIFWFTLPIVKDLV